MQSTNNTPISFLISLIVLFGLFVSDLRIGETVNSLVALPVNRGAYLAKEVAMSPATSTPNIDTNWFSVSSSGLSNQLPTAQARKDDDDDHVAQGGIMGDSFGNNDDY